MYTHKQTNKKEKRKVLSISPSKQIPSIFLTFSLDLRHNLLLKIPNSLTKFQSLGV